jgi:hypothetical protein
MYMPFKRFTKPILSAPAQLTFSLKVTDDEGAQVSEEVTVTIKASLPIDQLQFAAILCGKRYTSSAIDLGSSAQISCLPRSNGFENCD